MGPNLHFCCMRLPFPETFFADIFCICDRFQENWICIFQIQADCNCFLTTVTYIYIDHFSSETLNIGPCHLSPRYSLLGISRPTRKHFFWNISLTEEAYNYTYRIVSTTVWTLQVKKSIIF